MASMVSQTSPLKNDFEELRSKLSGKVIEKGYHPAAAPMSHAQEVSDLWLKVFSLAPQEQKRELATAPLWPKEIYLNRVDGISIEDDPRETTRPLNYHMYVANKPALEAIQKSGVLQKKDWRHLGLYKSTYMHAIIHGAKQNSFLSGDPVGCLTILAQEYPGSLRETNGLYTSPLTYLEIIRNGFPNSVQLQNNPEHKDQLERLDQVLRQKLLE